MKDSLRDVSEMVVPTVLVERCIGLPDLWLGFSLLHDRRVNLKILVPQKVENAIANDLFVFTGVKIFPERLLVPSQSAPQIEQLRSNVTSSAGLTVQMM